LTSGNLGIKGDDCNLGALVEQPVAFTSGPYFQSLHYTFGTKQEPATLNGSWLLE